MTPSKAHETEVDPKALAITMHPTAIHFRTFISVFPLFLLSEPLGLGIRYPKSQLRVRFGNSTLRFRTNRFQGHTAATPV
jgi:hypothetical protein